MIVIVDYGMGNLGSIRNMLKRIGAPSLISSDPSDIEAAAKLILPGVGAFDAGMSRLETLGLLPILNRKVLEERTPVLGLCLGMQLLTRASEEGALPGLGWLDAEAKRLPVKPMVAADAANAANAVDAVDAADEVDDVEDVDAADDVEAADSDLKIPHMGWNFVQPAYDSWLLADLPPDPRFYFVHSYYVACRDARDIAGRTRYGGEFASVVVRDHVAGVQFHPEKSHKYGMQLLKNFVDRGPDVPS